MPCNRVDMGNGNYAIVCSRGHRKPKKCAYCDRDGTQLCDHRMGPVVFGQPAPATCDTPMCRLHAHHVEPDTDLCRAHAPAKDGSQ